ncbi:hypothetical protein BZP36_25900 [Raoultella terrigena]|nr:hypothetical protein BZP36_25900 [Raoultella terrigena]
MKILTSKQGDERFRRIKGLSHQAILFAIADPGSAHHPHVRPVRSGCSALSVPHWRQQFTPAGKGSNCVE